MTSSPDPLALEALKEKWCTPEHSMYQFHSMDAIINYYTYCVPAANETIRRQMINAIAEEMSSLGNSSQMPLYELALLLLFNCILIVLGACGSGMVIFAVARNPAMRTSRNLFIVNLAVSDMVLCLFSQPFSLLRILVAFQEWPLGETMCKVVSVVQGTNMFVATISITAIALDRFQVILYPTRSTAQRYAAPVALAFIWTMSLIMASPLYVFSKLSFTFLKKAAICSESTFDSPAVQRSKFAYSLATVLIQYLLPLLLVSMAYMRICLRIRRRLNTRQGAAHSSSGVKQPTTAIHDRKQEAEKKRQRRANLLLSSIALIFALSWLPMNIINLVMSVREANFMDQEPSGNSSFLSTETVFILQALALMAVLVSVCINPILYGWLNENFRKEFQVICSCCVSRCIKRHDEAKTLNVMDNIQGAQELVLKIERNPDVEPKEIEEQQQPMLES